MNTHIQSNLNAMVRLSVVVAGAAYSALAPFLLASNFFKNSPHIMLSNLVVLLSLLPWTFWRLAIYQKCGAKSVPVQQNGTWLLLSKFDVYAFIICLLLEFVLAVSIQYSETTLGFFFAQNWQPTVLCLAGLVCAAVSGFRSSYKLKLSFKSELTVIGLGFFSTMALALPLLSCLSPLVVPLKSGQPLFCWFWSQSFGYAIGFGVLIFLERLLSDSRRTATQFSEKPVQ